MRHIIGFIMTDNQMLSMENGKALTLGWVLSITNRVSREEKKPDLLT